MDYVNLFTKESYETNGPFGIKILIAANKLPNLDEKSIFTATDKAIELIESAIKFKIKKEDPKTAIETTENRRIVNEIFNAPIFVEEIENGYCNRWCCKHLPWFVVTTSIGRFKIGWRKRVISIDWFETIGTDTADNLFTDENVTKYKKTIHAWSIEKAKQYVDTIIQSAK